MEPYFFDTNLLSYKEIKGLFGNAHIERERMLGITKSYYIIGNNETH